ncbi:MAG: (Fe-S)-binding protein [Actinomycetaceae bacterium]|nr:(Fe-S)-binding protein [Actinomycetaceae bacterium]
MTVFFQGAAFVITVVTVLGLGSFISGALSIWRRTRMGTPSPGRFTSPVRRVFSMVATVLTHGQFRGRPWLRLAHWLVMVSFPLLFVTLASSYHDVFSAALWGVAIPSPAFPSLLYTVWIWGVEVIAWLSLFGILSMIIFRQVKGRAGGDATARRGEAGSKALPQRFFGSKHGQALFVEFVILIVVFSVLMIHSFKAAQLSFSPEMAQAWYPLTSWMVPFFGLVFGLDLGAPLDIATSGAVAVGFSILKILVSMVWMIVVGVMPAMGIAWHRFLAFFTLFFAKDPGGRKDLGGLSPMRVLGSGGGALATPASIEDPEFFGDSPVFGASTLTQLTWKNLLDVQSCTECGRCQEVCPAWATGKPLSPKTLVMSIRDALDAGANGLDAPIPVGEELWDCTSCGACVQSCPVGIEHLDIVTSLRRARVLMDSDFPRDYTQLFRKTETRGNPWGLPKKARMDWAKGLDFTVPQIGVDVADATEVDYLLWVGCAGSYDEGGKAATAAFAQLLHMSSVSFAVLGNGETCTGDSARRAGNEILFLQQSSQVIAMLQEAKAKEILVMCPHCYTTIGKEYADFGAHFKVTHHTQLLNRLVRDGRLKLAKPEGEDGRVLQITYHDPCFLGRHNGEFDAPRALVSDIGQLHEMPRNRENSMCCGAGGGHAFVEESGGVRIADARALEAQNTGADIIATACHFCTNMLQTGVANTQGTARVQDIATLTLAAAQRAATSEARA